MRQGSSITRKIGFLASALAFLTLLLTVPYHVPVLPTVSESYLFGYSNRAGQLLLALAAILVASFAPAEIGSSAPGKPLSRFTLQKALAGSFVLAGLLYLVTRKMEGFGESIYLVDRIKLVLEGKTPYRDFEYAYGGFFLYVPAWMQKLLRLSIGDAYGLFWLVLVLLGTWLLYKTIQWIDEPNGRQRTIFLLVWSVSLTCLLSTGLNYTLFRFILPCFFSLVIYRMLSGGTRPNTKIAAFLLPMPMLIALLLVSPELGVSFSAGILAYLAWYGRLSQKPNRICFLVLVAGTAFILWVAGNFGLFKTLNAFRTGGLNFPLTGALHMLLFYLCIGIAASYVGSRLRSGQPSSLMALIAVSAGSLVAALGRCDQEHALLNPLGVMLAAFMIASGYRLVWRILWPAVWLAYFLIPFTIAVIGFASPLGRATLATYLQGEPAGNTTPADRWLLSRMVQYLGPVAGKKKFDDLEMFAHRDDRLDVLDMFHLPPHTIIASPFGFAPMRFGPYHTLSIDEGYFLSTVNLVTPEEVQQKTKELSSHPERPLLTPPGLQPTTFCSVDPAASIHLIRFLFVYPFRRTPAHLDSVTQPLCDYIAQNYHAASQPTPASFMYVLWSHN